MLYSLLLIHHAKFHVSICSVKPKVRQEKEILYDITYMQNLKYNANELIYEKETFTDIKTCGCQEKVG